MVPSADALHSATSISLRTRQILVISVECGKVSVKCLHILSDVCKKLAYDFYVVKLDFKPSWSTKCSKFYKFIRLNHLCSVSCLEIKFYVAFEQAFEKIRNDFRLAIIFPELKFLNYMKPQRIS